MKTFPTRSVLILPLTGILMLSGCIYVPPDYPPGAVYVRNGPGHGPYGPMPYRRPPPDREGSLEQRELEQQPDRGVPADPSPLPPAPSISERPPTTDRPSPAAENKAPTATKTTRAGRVKSPFPPYRELDVTGLSSGSLAQDPVSGKIFRVP